MTGWHGDQGPGGWEQAHGYNGPTAAQGGVGGPPPPPSRLPAVLGTTAIAVVVATVITFVLVNRDSGDEQGSAPSTSVSTAPSRPPSTTPTRTTSRPPTSSPRTTTTRPPTGGTIDNTAARLSYRVPADWKSDPAATNKVAGVDFTGAAVYGAYQCGGSGYSRTFAVSAAVQNPKDKDLTATKAATAFAKSFGAEFYPGSTVAEPQARATEVDGKKAVLAVARVTPKPSAPACEATAGEVSVLAVDLDNATADKPNGIALLVITSDLAGGPAAPKPLDSGAVRSIFASTRVM